MCSDEIHQQDEGRLQRVSDRAKQCHGQFNAYDSIKAASHKPLSAAVAPSSEMLSQILTFMLADNSMRMWFLTASRRPT